MMSLEDFRKKLEEFFAFTDWAAGVWKSSGWAKRVMLIGAIFGFVAVTVYWLLKPVPDTFISDRTRFILSGALGSVGVLVLWFVVRAKVAKPQPPGSVESRAIKGLLAFGQKDAEIFKRLQRDSELAECYQAITEPGFRFGVLSGESGSGKTSFLQAGMWPALQREHRCVYVKLTDLDPVAAIRQAVTAQLGLPASDASFTQFLSDIAQPNAKPTNVLTPEAAMLPSAAATRPPEPNAPSAMGAKPLILLLDQFEQFFVNFKTEAERQPFVNELNNWYRQQRALPVKLLVCVRSDFLDSLSELQEVLGYSLGPQTKFRLKRFRLNKPPPFFRSSLNQAIQIALNGFFTSDNLVVIAEATLQLKGKEAATTLLEHCHQIAADIPNEAYRANNLRYVVESKARLAEFTQDRGLLEQTLHLAESIEADASARATALQSVAHAAAKIAEVAKDVDLVKRFIEISQRIGEEGPRDAALQVLAAAAAKLGDFRAARSAAGIQISRDREVNTLALVLENWSKSRNPKLEEELSKGN